MEFAMKFFAVSFMASLFINMYFLAPSRIFRSAKNEILGWSLQAAAEAEAVAAITCSNHGRALLDGVLVDGSPACECNACFTGHDCSELPTDCAADADSGDPLFLEPYWRAHAASSAVMVAGWHRMSYSTTGADFISVELEKRIRLLHKAVGNAVADGRYIVFGSGSTQLLNALVYAISAAANSSSPTRVVATVPYYAPYRIQTDMFDSKEYEWEGVTSNWMNSSYTSTGNGFVEFVTSPNNPDGQLKAAVLGGSSVIYDRAYYWPHFTAIPEPADDDVMLFTASKLSGHASSRFGWALIKDENVYNKAAYYLRLNTMGVSRDTQLRILKLLKVILAELGTDGDIFAFGHETMTKRWQKINNIVSSSKRFSLQSISSQYCTYFKRMRDPSPAYAWIKCEMEEDRDCEAVLNLNGIISRSGTVFEADACHARLSLIKTQDDFELLSQKMEVLIAKEGVNSI